MQEKLEKVWTWLMVDFSEDFFSISVAKNIKKGLS